MGHERGRGTVGAERRRGTGPLPPTDTRHLHAPGRRTHGNEKWARVSVAPGAPRGTVRFAFSLPKMGQVLEVSEGGVTTGPAVPARAPRVNANGCVSTRKPLFRLSTILTKVHTTPRRPRYPPSGERALDTGPAGESWFERKPCGPSPGRLCNQNQGAPRLPHPATYPITHNIEPIPDCRIFSAPLQWS